MKISQAGIDLIKEFEGFRSKAYRDPIGVWTIGYGTTVLPNGNPVNPGMRVTRENAEEYLRQDTGFFESTIEDLISVPLNQNQFDALVSFTYNVGQSNLERSTLRKRLNGYGYNDAAQELLKWNKARDRKTGEWITLKGLTRRRIAERRLFLTIEIDDIKKLIEDLKPRGFERIVALLEKRKRFIPVKNLYTKIP